MVSSDGGKGSARRKEDAQAVRDNWDRIFGKKEPMIDENDIDNDEHDHEDDGEWTCDRCGGLMHRMPLQGYARCDDCGARQELINDDYT